jgi:aryl-alcohol dehydrogenase-like predicted oxidoreductase
VNFRALGNTGFRVSEIVFGAGAVGGVVFKAERDVRLEAVRRAIAGGVNWIDTAPSYGDGQSEENLGWILKEVRPAPHLSTKVRIDMTHAGNVEREVRRSMELSLRRLGRSSVDLVQLHTRIVDGPRLADGTAARTGIDVDLVLGKGGVADSLDMLRAEGVTRLTGITGLGDTTALHRVVSSGRFNTVQVYHNVLNPSAGRKMAPGFRSQDYADLIGAANRAGMGVFNIRVLAAGIVAGRQPPPAGGPISPGSDHDSDRRRAAAVDRALSSEPGTPAQRAIRFALADPRISGVLVGFSTLEQVDEALAASGMGPLPARAIARLQPLWESDFRPDDR